MSDYEHFLASKRLIVQPTGRDVPPPAIHPALFGFQRDLTRWALRKGRAAIFADTGLGKSWMQIEWARLTGARTLILAPLAVARQTVAEAAKLGVTVTYARAQEQAAPDGVTITNYEMLPHFDPAAFGAVVLDECFPPGTEVDTPTGRKHIEEFIIGDSILNAAGVDTVSDVHRREVSYAVRISIAGQRLVSSLNHPYFTRRGWVCAQDIIPGDEIMATAEAMRVVREHVHGWLRPDGQDEILRAILLSEMADAPAGASRESAHPGSREETRRETACLARVRQPKGAGRDRARAQLESAIVGSGGQGKDLPRIESHQAQTFRAWGQRDWFDSATTDLAGCARIDLGGGVSLVTGSTDSRLSDRLQARLSRARAANQYRGGWSVPLQPEDRRCETGRETPFARVDGLEILEPGHPALERFRDADGRLYFYDLEGTRHPSFSVGGYLVHNSGILKNFEGKTRTALIRAWQQTPYRLCCTATPAPNDIAELANHAEFLGVMSRAEMLASFFVHDDQGWRLKGHARQPFYRWLASWGMSLKRPSDLGYDDAGYALPPLDIQAVIVPTDYVPPGQLFPTTLKGVGDRAQVRKDTLDERVSRAAALIQAEPDESWLAWCGLNAEQDALTEALGDRAISIYGTLSLDEKETRIMAWLNGERPVLVTKTSIAGHGLNLQHCARQVFVGLSDSYEQYYQAIRRSWRFGQQRPVKVYIVLTEPEEPIYHNVLRKEQEAEATSRELVKHVAAYERVEIGAVTERDPYHAEQPMVLPTWLRQERRDGKCA